MFSDLQRFTETKRQFIALWNGGITTFSPSDGQWNTWLSLHSEAALLRAILKTTAKYLKSHGQMDAEYLVKYCSSVVPEPEAPAAEVPAVVEEKQITLSQSALDALIKSRQAASLRKAASAEAELARVKAITVGSAADATEIEKLRATISLEQQRAAAAEARAAQQEKAVLLTQLGTAIDAVSVGDVGKLIGDSIVQRDGKWVVVVDGVEQVNADGTAVTPQQHYAAWAADHLYAIRGRVLSGAGSTTGSIHQPYQDVPLARIFGKNSDSAYANQLSLKNPQRYQTLRVAAQKAGLI